MVAPRSRRKWFCLLPTSRHEYRRLLLDELRVNTSLLSSLSVFSSWLTCFGVSDRCLDMHTDENWFSLWQYVHCLPNVGQTVLSAACCWPQDPYLRTLLVDHRRYLSKESIFDFFNICTKLRMVVVPDNLNLLKYAELQQLAKACGIMANMKADKPRAAVVHYRQNWMI